MKLLEKLEEEYLAENISDEEYNTLFQEYTNQLSNIAAVDRIRAMQGKKDVDSPSKSLSKKRKAEKSKKEEKKLVDKYVVKTDKEKKEPNAPKKGIFVAIAIVCLVAAFMTGIGFGIFNFDFQPTNQADIVTVNETAFPEVKSNNTTKINPNQNSNSDDNSSNKTNSNSNSNSNKKPKKDSNSDPKPNSDKKKSDTKPSPKKNKNK